MYQKKVLESLEEKTLVSTGFNRATAHGYNTLHLKTNGDFSKRNIERD